MTTATREPENRVNPELATTDVVMRGGATGCISFNSVKVLDSQGQPMPRTYMQVAERLTCTSAFVLVACASSRVADWMNSVPSDDPGAIAVHVDRVSQLDVLQNFTTPRGFTVYAVVASHRLRPGHRFNRHLQAQAADRFDLLLVDNVDATGADVARAEDAIEDLRGCFAQVKTLTRTSYPDTIDTSAGLAEVL